MLQKLLRVQKVIFRKLLSNGRVFVSATLAAEGGYGQTILIPEVARLGFFANSLVAIVRFFSSVRGSHCLENRVNFGATLTLVSFVTLGGNHRWSCNCGYGAPSLLWLSLIIQSRLFLALES